MTSLMFRVHGLPAPQGSKRHVGHGVMVESSKAVRPWRQDVTAAALGAIADSNFQPFIGPVMVSMTFYFPRPKAHFGTGRNANRLKDSAPHLVATKPDIDKLQRSTFDALTTAGIWRDDNQVARVYAAKAYGQQPGARLLITSIDTESSET